MYIRLWVICSSASETEATSTCRNCTTSSLSVSEVAAGFDSACARRTWMAAIEVNTSARTVTRIYVFENPRCGCIRSSIVRCVGALYHSLPCLSKKLCESKSELYPARATVRRSMLHVVRKISHCAETKEVSPTLFCLCDRMLVVYTCSRSANLSVSSRYFSFCRSRKSCFHRKNEFPPTTTSG